MHFDHIYLTTPTSILTHLCALTPFFFRHIEFSLCCLTPFWCETYLRVQLTYSGAPKPHHGERR